MPDKSLEWGVEDTFQGRMNGRWRPVRPGERGPERFSVAPRYMTLPERSWSTACASRQQALPPGLTSGTPDKRRNTHGTPPYPCPYRFLGLRRAGFPGSPRAGGAGGGTAPPPACPWPVCVDGDRNVMAHTQTADARVTHRGRAAAADRGRATALAHRNPGGLGRPHDGDLSYGARLQDRSDCDEHAGKNGPGASV